MKFSFPFSNYFSSTSYSLIDNTSGQGGIGTQDFKVFSYSELKSAAHGFCSSNKIGVGRCGSVYKGRLKDGTFVVIKVLVQAQIQTMKGEREFISELAALSNIKHENLVTLRGCCINGDERFLVYDYMENNSLHHTFLGGEQNRMKFSWARRREVLLGIARGLTCLHAVEPPIVHEVITASNTLLDQDFNPKISDFGLSRMCRDFHPDSTFFLGPLIGNIAPEYGMYGLLTLKANVYNFGVLVLEIISGRSVAYFDLELGRQFLADKAWEMFRANTLVEMVDPVINGDFPEEEAVRFLKVGLLCLRANPRQRPRMSMAVKMLTNEINMNNIEIYLRHGR